MVVLAASICTRGGKAVLSRQFREMQRSRVEALLASFPKLVDAGNQHTTVEQDNVRYVYQPLDELYMVLITNRQSNILQDIDSLHLFAQVVTSICRSLDEREILRNAFELLSAFDEVVSLGYRENLTLAQIKTFLEMESHEERVAMIIESNKQLEATEQRKLKAKQLEMQRREQARAGAARAANIPRTPTYPTYTPPVAPVATENMNSYEAEKARKPAAAPLGRGMQLGKKSRTNNMFEQVRGDLGPEEEVSAAQTLVSAAAPAPARSTPAAAASATVMEGQESIHIVVAETITARLSREGSLESMEVKGDLQLRISDPALTQVKLNLHAPNQEGVNFSTHPKVDKPLFNSTKVVQLKEAARGFPANQSIGVMRWRYQAPTGGAGATLPITFTCWVNEAAAGNWSITVEYELTGDDSLQDVTVTIPFAGGEPQVASFDAQYEVSGDAIEWHIGTVDEGSPSGSFEFEAEADSDEGFFPMAVKFSKTKPYVDVDVSSVTLINEGADVDFSKEVKSKADNYVIV